MAVHDPRVPTPTQSFYEAVLDADAVVMATNHPEFASVLPAIADGAKRDALIVDRLGLRRAGLRLRERARRADPRRRLPAT